MYLLEATQSNILSCDVKHVLVGQVVWWASHLFFFLVSFFFLLDKERSTNRDGMAIIEGAHILEGTSSRSYLGAL